MNPNLPKLIAVVVLALAVIVALGLDWIAVEVGAPLLTLLIGYVVGNAQFTSREGNTAPIVSWPPPPAE